MPPAYEFRGNRNSRPSKPRHEFTFRYPRPATSERPLLRSKRETTPEQVVAPNPQEEKQGFKFAPVSDLSDSEEADMDVSTDDDNEEPRPRKRRALEIDGPGPSLPAPKWSNPDPYTSLPPPDESQSRKVDVVKLIRKARVAEAAQPVKADPVTANEDFISFGPMEEDKDDDEPPPDAPRGPRQQLQDDPALGRKRTHDDEIKGYSKKSGKPLSRFHPRGSIIEEWMVRPYESGTPWVTTAARSLHVGARLHNEILSFYHWAKPQPYEQIVRADLLERLQSAFQNRYHGAQLRPFGSFASGVYLPTADLDLVLLSTSFVRKGIKTFGERKGQIYAFAAFLKGLDLAVPGSIETIAHARVPILKFVDKLTGLRVDLSFDNDSGLVANNTFQRWKAEIPAMPVIVSVIKQFLLLRGLNEVPTGGLGGFSITCLVMSLLQHLPHGYMEPNLATVLMDFFDFYGNQFDFDSVGIRMNPPGYFNKRVIKSHLSKGPRLSIEDPNNPDNDISGGTREILLIMKCFSEGHQVLKERMGSLATGSTYDSILGTIIAANYDEYTQQRWQLRKVFETNPRFASYRQPPPPPPPLPASPPPADPVPPPPSPPVYEPKPAKQQTKQEKQQAQRQARQATKQQRREQASRDRAARLGRVRPDIRNLPLSITNEQALSLGGYSTQSEMDRDIVSRERALKTAD